MKSNKTTKLLKSSEFKLTAILSEIDELKRRLYILERKQADCIQEIGPNLANYLNGRC